MRIVEEYKNVSIDLLKIDSANYVGDFAVRVLFSDGHNILVDFKPFLTQSLHPSVKKYLDEKLFKQFTIVDGNLNWNDYDMIFSLDNIYKGTI